MEQPEVSKREALKAGSLEWVNAIRIARGAGPLGELPKGVPRDSRECVVARALAGVHDHSMLGIGAPAPPTVIKFAYRFDRGEYPELIA